MVLLPKRGRQPETQSQRCADLRSDVRGCLLRADLELGERSLDSLHALRALRDAQLALVLRDRALAGRRLATRRVAVFLDVS